MPLQQMKIFRSVTALMMLCIARVLDKQLSAPGRSFCAPYILIHCTLCHMYPVLATIFQVNLSQLIAPYFFLPIQLFPTCISFSGQPKSFHIITRLCCMRLCLVSSAFAIFTFPVFRPSQPTHYYPSCQQAVSFKSQQFSEFRVLAQLAELFI